MAPGARESRVGDRALLDRARGGDTEAFDRLYRRHADAAWRTARSMLADPDDAADAVADAFASVLRLVKTPGRPRILHFRAYLLTTTRNAAYDRRRRREVTRDPLEPETDASDPPLAPSASDTVIDLTDSALAVRAFRELPERWQEVLWLTEVEGLRPVDVAPRLEMTANAVAQLAFRARASLRERYLAAHLNGHADDRCAETVERLAAYLLERLGAAERHDVEDHLDSCAECAVRHEELVGVGPVSHAHVVAPFVALGAVLRRAVVSIPAAAPAAGTAATVSAAHVAAAGVAVALTATGAIGGLLAQAPEARETAVYDSVDVPAESTTSMRATETSATALGVTASTGAAHAGDMPGAGRGPSSERAHHGVGQGGANGNGDTGNGSSGNGSNGNGNNSNGNDGADRPGNGGGGGPEPGPPPGHDPDEGSPAQPGAAALACGIGKGLTKNAPLGDVVDGDSAPILDPVVTSTSLACALGQGPGSPKDP